MRKIHLSIIYATFALSSFAQLQPSGLPVPPATAYRFGETQIGGFLNNNNIRAIGIGNFSTLGGGATPQARLHVNSFYFPAANSNATVIALAGNLFRTDGNTNVINQWQLFTGANANFLLAC